MRNMVKHSIFFLLWFISGILGSSIIRYDDIQDVMNMEKGFYISGMSKIPAGKKSALLMERDLKSITFGAVEKNLFYNKDKFRYYIGAILAGPFNLVLSLADHKTCWLSADSTGMRDVVCPQRNFGIALEWPLPKYSTRIR